MLTNAPTDPEIRAQMIDTVASVAAPYKASSPSRAAAHPARTSASCAACSGSAS